MLETPITYYDTGLDIISADVNKEFNVLVTSHTKSIVQFHSIADVQNIYLFKEFKLLENSRIEQVVFSSDSHQVAALSIESKRIVYILTSLQSEFEVLGYVNLPYTPVKICWNKTSRVPIKAKYEHLLVGIGFGVLMVNGPQAVSQKNRAKDLELHCDIYAVRTDLEQK